MSTQIPISNVENSTFAVVSTVSESSIVSDGSTGSKVSEETSKSDSEKGKHPERKAHRKLSFKGLFHHHHSHKDGNGTPHSETELNEGSEVNSTGSVNGDDLLEGEFKHEYGDEYEDLDAYMPPSVVKPSGAIRIRPKKIAILYNPKSGAQKGEKLARRTEKIFKDNGIEVAMVMTERRGHGEELAREMPLDDIDVLCFLGGDGTFHECLNGFMNRKDDAVKRVALAVLPGGTGNSFALELQGNNHMSNSIRSILRGIVVQIDIAHMYFPINDESIYSFNSIHWGMGTKINITAERLRWMGKAIRYSTAAALELMRGSTADVVFEMVDKNGKFFEVRGQYSLMIANNIMSTLKGMKMVPDARINDGLIDLLLIKSGKTSDLVSIFKRVYNGTHTELDCVDYYQVKSFALIPFSEYDDDVEGGITEKEVAEELLDIDGELKGKTPFKCTMMPKHIKVIV
eukprot:TRINITY_DN3801_c0_g1_i1.p1 TRINITY_DN3801_c0_g1~~TRINITY_DN3801_c0_g1_i1.p1  ORF type:complete len:458 (-),score=180.66 TRINITY_DN3801_c0_g1_i1:81-1454(-)